MFSILDNALKLILYLISTKVSYKYNHIGFLSVFVNGLYLTIKYANTKIQYTRKYTKEILYLISTKVSYKYNHIRFLSVFVNGYLE